MITITEIETAFDRLGAATKAGSSDHRCLRRWSEFIRLRDGHRCVDCRSRRRLSAHHICRKAFLPEARFQTGNGITLCNRCHRKAHKGFNGRPDLSLPMDAQNGEKLSYMERLYCILAQDAKARALLRDDFYFLSDQVLAKFKLFQGFEWQTPFPGSRVEQAYLIWAQGGLNTRRALCEANGFPAYNGPILPGSSVVVIDEDGEASAFVRL